MKKRALKDCILGAIDIGTNSIHMVVVKINAQIPSFSIIAKEKDTVRLGDRNFETGNLTEEAINRSLAALKRCKHLAQSLKVDQIIAVATSATREAPNGKDFLKQIETELGIVVDLISGPEEARRIYLGVLSGMDFGGKVHGMIDIGGGSTEIILGDNQEARFLSSTKIGAVSLTRDFIHSDPLSNQEYITLQCYVRGILERPVEEFKNALKLGEKPVLVGTSGTAETLALIHSSENQGVAPLKLNGYQISRQDIEKILHKLIGMNYAQRASLPAMSERRAEIIISGTIILLEAMKMLDIDCLTICERALREGVIVDWMLQNGYIEDRLSFQGEVRPRNIYKIAHKYQVDLNHADKIADFALNIFDSIKNQLHFWGDLEREYLWSATILHNSGLYISHSAHHKHSYYLIRNAELLGFSEIEIELIAQIARYHRKSKPKRKHETYANLSDSHRKMIKQLSAILRLAIALDRRQIRAIKTLECRYDHEYRQLHLHLTPRQPNDDCALELWNLDYKKPIFEQEYQVKVLTTLHK
ncbi:MAG: Ppx/GppA family phosphatase [Cyanobacteria bacterium]|nr:Ppx/GppA family phosphatase [Cyanobacteria bacterium CG_2015-16_32_12]NCO78688.1 Ppx/GppA family phosphatase [Cyanobacteria bacterium CG_2015-22_32_23]NCQ03171.1 Ppx/GppA family phosphatase [Cyanobacteria bacterium CG_2015-09_32_10]NCQ41443.1 Ppx/GppA family phosphatase [Cyanobacteria bacterium CG_2015-04_32_10]NCS85747.1 Ppx/GppA family phosphatase [Cyanobacteria bacterium CG_2015-02_32_10]